MTAQEMFKELGYKKRNGYCSINYTKKIDSNITCIKGRTIEKHIDFVWQDIEGVEIYETIFDKQFLEETIEAIERPFLSSEEIEAINEQIEELGWL